MVYLKQKMHKKLGVLFSVRAVGFNPPSGFVFGTCIKLKHLFQKKIVLLFNI